jgi:hypothetical protein
MQPQTERFACLRSDFKQALSIGPAIADMGREKASKLAAIRVFICSASFCCTGFALPHGYLQNILAIRASFFNEL